MEYKILDIKNLEKSHINNIKIDNVNKKFERILKNLLDIKTKAENALFFKLNKKNFDLFHVLNNDENLIRKIFEQTEFELKIPMRKISDVKNILNSLETFQDFIEHANDLFLNKKIITSLPLDPNINLSDQKTWNEMKKIIIDNNLKEIDLFNSKWKRYQKEINDKYEETNIWPLYVGSYFLHFKVNKKEVFAPLILKEVSIKSNNNNFYIHSENDSILLNEKLVFFLSEFKNIDIPPLFEGASASMKELSDELDAFFNESEIINTKIQQIQRITSNQVNTTDHVIIKSPGIIMAFLNPLGSALRKATLKLIEFNKLSNNLINFKSDFIDLSDEKLTSKVVDKKSPVARICQTDLSQEKSILAALEDSAVIIGPPGTGKSQTIANIIANILMENKSALFISQKKVALDVVLERLGFLKIFTFQPLDNSSKIDSIQKQEFYLSLKKWIEFNFISGSYYNQSEENKIIPLMSRELNLYWEGMTKNISEQERKYFYKLISLIPFLDNNFFDFVEKYKNEFNSFTKEEISLFNKINLFFNTNITNEDLQKIIDLKNSLYNLNLEEIKNFLELENEQKNINKIFLNLLIQNKDKIRNLDWSFLEKFLWLNNFSEQNGYQVQEMLVASKNIFKKLKSINHFEDINKLFALSHNKKDIKYFAKEFGISKKGIFPFKFYGKEFKKFWSVNLDFINYISNFQLNKHILSFLCENDNQIQHWINHLNFLLDITKYKVNEKSWNLMKKNIGNFDIWLTSYNFIEIVKNYNLNEEMIIFIKSNLDLLSKLSSNFQSNKEFFKNLSFYNFTNEIISYLDPLIADIEKYRTILNVYNEFHHNNFIPKTNQFINNEEIIKNKIKENVQEIYRGLSKEEKVEFTKWKGRIESAYTVPYKLFSRFKNLFKKFFKIVVSTPEALATKIDFLTERYDYVIFDEASQLFLERAIPFLAIADRAIIAGDDQQMQPSNWFSIRSENETIEEEDENDENVDSLLTYAINSGIPKYLLELNYRSKYACLTSFSSKHFYESKLKALDSNIDRSKPIIVHQVNGEWVDSSNIKEAERAIELLKENIDQYQKIIILTLNKQQMELIDLLLSEKESEIYNKMINERSIILKNLENIQGDEADLVIVSVAYTRDTHLAGTYVCRPTGRNALNVAITRAKDKMIILKSINAEEIRSSNANVLLFKEWLSFLDLNTNQQKVYSIDDSNHFENIQNIESGFEKEVYDWLRQQQFNKRITIEAQYSLGSYRIDFALLEEGSRKFLLGIEVDGWKYHSRPKQIYNDTIRQQFIESKGYKLLRIPEMMWKINKEKILAKINKYLEI